MIERTMASPIPIPVGLVVKKGSNSLGMTLGGTPFPESRTDTRIPPESSKRAHNVTSRGPRLSETESNAFKTRFSMACVRWALSPRTEGREPGTSIDHEISFILASGIDNGTYYMLEPDMNHYRDDAGTGNVLRSACSGLRAWLSCADASAPGSGGPTAPNSKLIGASPPLMRVACSTTNESLPMSRTTRPTDGESREADTV